MRIVAAVDPHSHRCEENGCHRAWVRRRNASPEHRARKLLTKERRRRIYQRDGFRCVRCGSGKDLTVGHEPPLATQLDPLREYADEELVTECRPCNSSAGATLRRTVPLDMSADGRRVLDAAGFCGHLDDEPLIA
jgi:5-methylcytosine-specific restriction endonuclease McrA